MKKLLTIVVAFYLAVLLAVSGCAQEEMRTFTDSLGREVTVPQKMERIAVTGPLGQIVVFAIAPDMLVGIPHAWDPIAQGYLEDRYYQLPVVGQIYGGKGEMNLEALLASSPQVVIDVGEPSDGVAKDMDVLSEQTGIPFVHIAAYLDSMDETYRMLGDLLGLVQEGEALAQYCARAYQLSTGLMSRVGQKAKLLYITGEKGLNVLGKGSYHSIVIDTMSDNMAALEHVVSKGTGNEVDMEQIMNWNPDVVLFSEDSIYDSVGSDPLWQEITAIKNNTYYEVPAGPYNWIGMPPSVQRLLGMLWMGKLLYPQEADYDLQAETQAYYRLFYHCELTQAQYDALMAKSICR